MRVAFAAEPQLPFVLRDRTPDDSAAVAVFERLDALYGLMTETRAELAELRLQQARLLELVLPRLEAVAPARASVIEVEVATPVPPAVQVRLLGAFELSIDGRPVDRWRSRKARQLLAYLALTPGRPTARETLIETFWPDSDPARGANNLSIAVHHVRSRLGETLGDGDGSRGLLVEQGLYRLDGGLMWRVDAVAFRESVARAKSEFAAGRESEGVACLEAALAEYGGDFLESDLTEEWTSEPRLALGNLYEWAIGRLIEHATANGDWSRVLQLGQALVLRDLFDEAAHRWVVRAHAMLGNRAQAMRQYRLCEERLRAEFDVEPSEETQVLLTELGLD